MELTINVQNQRLYLATNLKTLVSGSNNFVKFTFALSSEWDDLLPFVQFQQEGNTYNKYLDNDKSVYLPYEIEPGKCTLMLYGSAGNVIATTNYLELNINDNMMVVDADSIDISTSLYNQLTQKVNTALKNEIDLQNQIYAMETKVDDIVSGTLVASTLAGMTDTTKVYVYVGSETGMVNGNWYYYNGSAWTSGGVYNAAVVDTATVEEIAEYISL